MKTPRHAFTLIELLTVIAIIAILMALLFPAVNAIKDTARKAVARNDMTHIVTAVKGYFTDYSMYPPSDPTNAGGDATDVVFGGTDGTKTGDYLFKILRATPWTDTDVKTLNPKRTVYIEGRMAKNTTAPSNGFGSDGKFYDPWGGEYVTVVDGNNDNRISTDKLGYTDVTIDVESPVAVMSFGRDGQRGSKTGAAGNNKLEGSDDVASWR
jgi:prepilin-type N-terminal cleavage/methylation domain-containing protein